MKEQLSDEFADNFLINIREIWVQPEIEKRRVAGTLPENFSAYAIQVIFDDDLEFAEVRFNEEVDAIMGVDFARNVEPGDEVTIQDIGDVKRIQLTEKDANAGHITIVRKKNGYAIAFDLTRNVERSSHYLKAAIEFAETSELALDNDSMRAFLDNLHSTVELLAKGLLIMHERSVLTSKTHRHVSAKLNAWTRYGNVDARYSQLLNQLQSLRKSARYLEGNLNTNRDDARQMLIVAKQMIEDLKTRIRNSERAVLPETQYLFGIQNEE